MTIKDRSLEEFLMQNLAGISEERLNQQCNIYNLLQDNIFLKRQFEPGTYINFELKDRTIASSKDLLTKWKYEIVEYDDVCVKARLVNFEVETVEKSDLKQI